MKLDFCCICGTKENLHNHHIIPRYRGGSDDETNLITLCGTHHSWIHGLQPTSWNSHGKLVKQGIEKFRKENGDVWGRRTNLTEQSRKNIIRYRSCGWGIKRLAKKFSVSNQTVRKVLSEQKQEHEHVLDLVKNFRHIVE
jgi:DNA invertase Pin-like site-specific DNA recombinase